MPGASKWSHKLTTKTLRYIFLMLATCPTHLILVVLITELHLVMNTNHDVHHYTIFCILWGFFFFFF